MLTRNQFDILQYFEAKRKPATQRSLSGALGRSLGVVNKTLKELAALGYTDGNRMTEKGLEALEPYRVRRAVILAAGFGQRLMPITLNTPKPLVRVHGKRIIDTILDAFIGAGIEEITIVRGYLGEQFDQLMQTYPNIELIDNPDYNVTGNISSAMYVRDRMENAYVSDADFLICNPGIVTKYQYTSNYLGVPVERTDDWCIYTNGRYITRMQLGGTNCYVHYGFSYWTKEHGRKLRGHIPLVYEMPGGKERFWDQVPLEYFNKEYKVEVRPCTFDDLTEIDTYAELVALDSTYKEL